MTTVQRETYPIHPGEPFAMIYICEPGREPFIHRLPLRVIEPWHYRTLIGSSCVLFVLPPGFAE